MSETVRLVSDVQYSIADALVQLFLHKKTPKVSYSTHTCCELTMPNLYAHSVNCYCIFVAT